MEAVETRQVVKIEMVGAVTSFRYPHFTQGFQPTFEMPPPSTIYGHICSAVGNWLNIQQLADLEFGYHFTHQGKFVDYKEHLHFSDPIQPFPFDRELLFNPRLSLYLTDLNLLDAFRNPHFAVVLGRSQDLMTYHRVEIVTLEKVIITDDDLQKGRSRVYFAGTLLPLEMSPRLDRGTIAVTMARYIDERRRPNWGTYALLSSSALFPPPPRAVSIYDDEDDDLVLRFETDTLEIWIDPQAPHYPGKPDIKRAIWFHRFVEA